MKNIQYGTEFLDQLKDRVHDLYDENVKLKEEIERLNNIINTSITKVQEIKDHIDKSKFDGTTKSILIMALNEIIYSLNGKGVDKK